MLLSIWCKSRKEYEELLSRHLYVYVKTKLFSLVRQIPNQWQKDKYIAHILLENHEYSLSMSYFRG